MSLSTLLSPVLGGIILANFNLYWALMVDVFTAAIELLCMTKIKLQAVKAKAEAVAESAKVTEEELLSGFKYIFKNDSLRYLFYIYAAGFLLMTPVNVLSLLFVQRHFGASVVNLTLQEIAWAAGSVIAGLLVAKHKEFKNNATVLGLGVGTFAAVMVVTALSPTIWFYLAMMFLLGVASPYYYTNQAVIIQTESAQNLWAELLPPFK